MNGLFKKIFIGTEDRWSGAMALAIVALIALGCTCGKDFNLGNLSTNSSTSNSDEAVNTSEDVPTDERMPPDRLLRALVVETTAQFALGVSEEDFSKLYENASIDFQNTYTEDQVRDVFKTFIDNKRTYLPILAQATKAELEFDGEPYIRTEQGLDILVANGQIKTTPAPINFEYEYVKRNDKWKLLKLVIRI